MMKKVTKGSIGLVAVAIVGFAGVGGSANAVEPAETSEAEQAAVLAYQDETGASEDVAESVIADQTSIAQAVNASGLV